MRHWISGLSLVFGLLGSGAICLSGAHGQTLGGNNGGSSMMPVAATMSGGGCGCQSPACSDCGGGCRDGCQLGSRLGDVNLAERFESIMESRFGCNDECAEDLGDPWTLFGRNCDEPWLKIGGWFSAGWHENSNDLFNSEPDEFNLHQGWLFAEKVAESKCGEFGFGFRFDGMYGIDAPDTQAFGNPGATWDLDPRFTRGGGFGWALPQVYGEVAKGDWTVKVGHFYTLVGYEVVPAPDNFFYSHAITMYNSEPFTHTGAIASYQVSDNTTAYGGWTAGWDTGFDFTDGSNFLGGFSTSLGEDNTLTYITTFGDFGARGDDAYSHSFVLNTALSDNLTSVLQSDLVRVDSTGEDNVGLNHYLFYQCSPRIAFGKRTEWWKGDDVTGYTPYGSVSPGVGSQSHYEGTWGINVMLNANVRLRPEYRYNWSPALDYEEGQFGMDIVATY